MQQEATIRVDPVSINFRDVAKDEMDSVDVWACNCGKAPVRIRFSLEPDSPFELITSNSGMIPPGLETKATVRYVAKDQNSHKSELTIGSPNCTVKVPITVDPPCSRIVTDHHHLKLGDISVDDNFKFGFSLSNIGIKEGKFKLICTEEIVSMSPVVGSIPPNSSQEISCAIKPSVDSPINFFIDVETPDSLVKKHQIEVSANAIKHTLSLQIDCKDFSELNFGTIFHGQKRILSATLTNNGPTKRSFVVLIKGEEKFNRPSELAGGGRMDEDSIFTSIPSEGTLEPRGSVQINFIYTPPLESRNHGDTDITFKEYSSIQIVETSQKLDFTCVGKAVNQYISLSAVDFLFDKSEVGRKQTKKLIIKNGSRFLPIDYVIKPRAHFRFIPEKGVIPANQRKEVDIVFFPKNYGDLKNTTTINFCSGLSKRVINLDATCGQLKDGPFRRVPVWETSESAKYTKEHPDKRYSYTVQESRRNSLLKEQFEAYMSDLAQKREAKSRLLRSRQKVRMEAEAYLSHTLGKYTEDDVAEYIADSMAKNKSSVVDNELTAFAHGSLSPPEPATIIRPAPLYIGNPSRFGLSSPANDELGAHKARSSVAMDDNVLIKKKFKAKPTTPAEISECSRSLTPAQQLMVVASHQTLNFGLVSVFSTVAKSFCVTNNLQQHILVTINFEHEELAKSSPASQVILPKQTAGFDIRFSSHIQHNFLKAIHYTINNHHTCTLNISAQVVPMDVHLSRQALDFRFSPDSDQPIIKEFITLHNRSNAPAEYNWTGENSVFRLSCSRGVIDALKTENIEITYTPGNHSHDEATLVMNVTGGQSKVLKCVADIGSPKCSVSKKIVNFGLIPIGILKSQTIRVRNTGDDDAIFIINHNSTSELQIIPTSGRIGAHDFQTIQINIKCVHPQPFDILCTMSIAGTNPIVFNVTGQSELPHVEILRKEFDFGRLFVGSSAAVEGTIQNTGAIPAILYLDLTNHPFFRLEYPASLSTSDGGEKTNSITLVSNPIFVTKMNKQVFQSTSMVSTASVEEQSVGEDELEEAHQGLVYKFYLVENSSVTFNLVYQPTEVGEHSFVLPFTMMNIISSSSFHLQPIVSAESVQAPLNISSSALDFGVAPIFNPSNPNARPVVRQITLTNLYQTPLPWRIGNQEILGKPPSFSIEPSQGTIPVGGDVVVHISFMARQANPYNIHLPVLTKLEEGEEKEESLVSQIQLTGVGTRSLFSIAHPHIALPIVPLNIKSQFTSEITNDAFIEATLNPQFSAEENHFPIRIHFPEGNHLLRTTAKLPVVISFVSSHPMSFSTLVALIDDNGNATSFTVAATTDNSVFTLYPFLSRSFGSIKSSKGGPITYECKTVETPHELTSRFMNVRDVSELKGVEWKASATANTVVFVQRYLNALSLNTQLTDFPNDFIRNDGALFFELISNLSNGKKFQNETVSSAIKPVSIADDISSKKLEVMKKLIRFIQSFGGMISSVRAEFLLPRSDFLQLMKVKITKQLLGIDRFGAPDISDFNQQVLSEFTSSKAFASTLMSRLKVLESLYNELSLESWMMCTMQLFKIFIVSKIDSERINHAPGIQEAIKGVSNLAAREQQEEQASEVLRPNKNLSHSNVYSVQECGLLKWASVHLSNVSQDVSNAINDFSKLGDSIAFTALLKAHTSAFRNQIPTPTTDKGFMASNAISFVSALKSLKLPFCPHAEEVSEGNCCIYAILLSYLFESLPKFIPITQVDFCTSLHKVIVRPVSIQNPSKAEITYMASLDGSPTFSLPCDQVTIGPNATVDFSIQFNARTIKPQLGRLSLQPLRPRYISQSASVKDNLGSNVVSGKDTPRNEGKVPIFSSPLVFDLISSVTLTVPDLTTNIEGPIYQTTPITIPLKNFIGTKAKCKVYMRVVRIMDENEKPIPGVKTHAQQIQQLISDPSNDVDQGSTSNEKNPFSKLCMEHSVFVPELDEVEFASESSLIQFPVDFIPISLGTYRCLMFFQDEKKGEFLVEILGKSVLPPPQDVNAAKFKTEAGKKSTNNLIIDPVNLNLIKALAYSIEKKSAIENMLNERKFKELVSRRQHDLEGVFKQTFTKRTFTVINSSPVFFELPSEVSVYKTAHNDNSAKGQQVNSLPVLFKPIKAGDYPVKICLLHKYDVRVYRLVADGLAALKELSIEFATVAGQPIKQEISFSNPSKDTWNFKILIQGDPSFTSVPRLSVRPGQSGVLPIIFNPTHMGEYTSELTVQNTTKESTIIYKLFGKAGEPPAERKIIVNCQARSKHTEVVDLKALVNNGNVNVVTTVPIISFNKVVAFENGKPKEPFKFTVLAPRSGLSIGTLTFTDPVTKNFIWYVVEIHVASPEPEQTIKVVTVARKCATVTVPVHNPKQIEAKFQVILSDSDLFGAKELVVPEKSTVEYNLVVSPLKAVERTSSVYFYSDEAGEFWFSIKIIATEAPDCDLAPLTSPIGKFASTFIQLENPLDKNAIIRVENSNPTAFHLMAKKLINLLPYEKKRIEVRYLPTCVGSKELANISFKSQETGDWTYNVTGVGKPPQPLSPTIVNAQVKTANSALVLFNNPFPYPAKFSVSMTTEAPDGVFKFLMRSKTFSLASYNEEYQIPFIFSPQEVLQYQAHIVIAYVGPLRSTSDADNSDPMPGIRWVYPVIGNSLSEKSSELKILKCRSMETVETELEFLLVGETEVFEIGEYVLDLNLSTEAEFLRYSIDLKAISLQRPSQSPELTVMAKFSPQRPISTVGRLSIRNPLGQEWLFDLHLESLRGNPLQTITIESLLNKTGTAEVNIPAVFRQSTPFHAYFAQGSATEFTVTPVHGFIEPTITDNSHPPITVVFAPKMYGKVLQGLLVIDTMDSQYLFDVVGKTPEYVPPVITGQSRLSMFITNDDAQRSTVSSLKKKRNIIKENIELAKLTKPRIISPNNVRTPPR